VRTVSADPLLANLLAAYHLSDTADSSGNGRTLTNTGSVTFASGKIGNAAVGNDAGYLHNTALSLDGASAFTVCGWINLSAADMSPSCNLLGRWSGGVAATSATSIDLDTVSGNTAITLASANAGFTAGKLVRLQADESNYALGTVVSNVGTTLTVNVTSAVGSGATAGLSIMFEGYAQFLLSAGELTGGTSGTHFGVTFVRGPVYTPVESIPTLLFNVWHFVAARWDGTNMKLRVVANGGAVSDATPVENTEALPASDGVAYFSLLGLRDAGWADPTPVVSGKLDAVHVWSRALSDAELVSMYAAGTGIELGS
jgi:hypothetical protein